MYKLALTNLTGNIPCVCFIAGGVYLIDRGHFGTGLFLLIMASITVVRYRQVSSNNQGAKDE